jgi:tetratricopeptide (TPR) repeat protein
MKQLVKACIVSVFIGIVYIGLAGAQSTMLDVEGGQNNAAPGQTSTDTPYDQALAHYKAGEYDEAIKILEGPTATTPYDLPLNALLSKALLDKAEKLKERGDSTYKQNVGRAYAIGVRLYKVFPTKPDPYYIVAKSLVLNKRPQKAGGFIKKAVYFSSPANEDYADYQVTLGDVWTELMVVGNPRGYRSAKAAYQMARSLHPKDADFVAKVDRRLALLEKRYFLKR